MTTNELETPVDDTEAELFLVERVERQGVSVVIVTFNRPAALNPIDFATISAIDELLTAIEADHDIRALVFTGAGRAFSAGGDLKAYQRLFRDPPMFDTFMSTFSQVCSRLEGSRLVTAAMVNGTCVAGGLELVLACDLVTIASDAQIGDGHLRFSQLPGAGGSQRLARSIGLHRARHWFLTGNLFPAAEAVAAGLAVGIAEPTELRDYTLDVVLAACKAGPQATREMKSLLNLDDLPLARGLDEEPLRDGEHATEGRLP